MDAFCEAFFPVRDVKTIGLLDLRLVHYTVVWTSGGGRVFAGVERTYLTIFDAGNAMNGLGEIVP